MMNVAESNLWDNVLQSIKTKLQRESFETWFDPIRFEGIDRARGLVHLRVPNQMVRDWVKINYANLIDQSFCELSLDGYSVDWMLPADTSPPAVPVSPVQERGAAPDLTPEPAPAESGFSKTAAATALAPAREVAFRKIYTSQQAVPDTEDSKNTASPVGGAGEEYGP